MITIDPIEFFSTNLSDINFSINEALDFVDELETGRVGFKIGIKNLDEKLSLMPGELTSIAARSGSGKTAIAMQIVYSVLKTLENTKRPGKICIFSAEMQGKNLMMREACARERIPYWKVLDNLITSDERQRVRERLNALRTDRIRIDESSSPTLEHMISQLQIVQDEFGKIAFVLFDYTELAGGFDGTNEGQRIAKISRGLKAIAKKFHCPVLTLSQLNRDIEGRTDRTPTMRDLMHGGEREPDCIMIFVRPWLYDKTEQRELVNAHIVKNRNGPLGDTVLLFHDEIMRFESAEVYRSDLNED